MAGFCCVVELSNIAITLRTVRKRFGPVAAVDGISLEVAPGEFFSLLGPSGCGKTTLLRLIGGFEEPDGGEILIESRSMRGVPPQKRPVNTVFQNYALFPHLNVFDNVSFGLRMKGIAASEIRRRTEAVLDLAHVSDLRSRFPTQLSGGQKQRVALARAIVNEPAVLLLDEPLAAIDAKLRAQLQSDLRNLQRSLKTTFVYVTHDQDEALALSDRIAVLRSGRVAQCGTPSEIYEHPRTRFVASFLGGCNILNGNAIHYANGFSQVDTSVGRLCVAGAIPPGPVCLGIRREQFLFTASTSGATNILSGRIRDRAYSGAQTEYAVEVMGEILHAWEPSGSLRSIGDLVALHCEPEAIFPLEDS